MKHFDTNIKTLKVMPPLLAAIADPPDELFVMCDSFEELLRKPRVAIVGTRKPTIYGQQVTRQLAKQLAEQGIVIVSGLALGVDSIAHRAALVVGGLTMAVLPGSLDRIVPRTHEKLAYEIVQQGGALVSEYPADTVTYRYNFVERNRLVSGLSDAVIITEAAEGSGSRHTAEFAIEQGRELFIVPGNITSPTSVAANNLLKSGQGHFITSYRDVLFGLGIADKGATPIPRGRTIQEQLIINLIAEGINEGETLLEKSCLSVSEFNRVLTSLEISGKLRALGANRWAVT